MKFNDSFMLFMPVAAVFLVLWMIFPVLMTIVGAFLLWVFILKVLGRLD